MSRQTMLFAASMLSVLAAFAFLIAEFSPVIDMSSSYGARMTNVAHTTETESGRTISSSKHDVTPLLPEQIDILANDLTPEEAKIILGKGTEAPHCGNLLDNKLDGTYVCRLCKLPLFASDSKYNSESGWPSFFQPFDEAHVHTETDVTYGMKRTEILCIRCDAHLGHVFDDGPKPTGMRFCVNSASLEFVGADTPLPTGTVAEEAETAYFAGGCFWGIEDHLQQIEGVHDAVSGYMGGVVANPTYKQICYADTGHAEVVRVRFDASKVSYKELLDWFFKIHDPTQINRQGPDIGTQYRSAIFPANETQREQALAFIKEANDSKRFKRPVATKVEPSAKFWKAEEYHQDYHAKHGGSCPLPTFE